MVFIRSLILATFYLLVGSICLMWVQTSLIGESIWDVPQHLKETFVNNTFAILSLYLGAISIIYWNLRTKFASQWKYCANLYNKIFIDKIGSINADKFLYLKCTLALDLLAMDFWNHKSFRKLFGFVLEKSIDFAYQNPNEFKNCQIELETSKEVEIHKFLARRHSVERAYTLISKYQNTLELIVLSSEPDELVTPNLEVKDNVFSLINIGREKVS